VLQGLGRDGLTRGGLLGNSWIYYVVFWDRLFSWDYPWDQGLEMLPGLSNVHRSKKKAGPKNANNAQKSGIENFIQFLFSQPFHKSLHFTHYLGSSFHSYLKIFLQRSWGQSPQYCIIT